MTPVCMLLLNDILKRIHRIPTRLGNRFSITWFTAHNSKNNSRHNMQCLSYFYLSQTNSSETLRCGLDKTSKGVMASSTKMLEADPSGYFCFLIHQHKSPSSFCFCCRVAEHTVLLRSWGNTMQWEWPWQAIAVSWTTFGTYTRRCIYVPQKSVIF